MSAGFNGFVRRGQFAVSMRARVIAMAFTAAAFATVSPRTTFADHFYPTGAATNLYTVSTSSFTHVEGPYYDGTGVLFCALSSGTNDTIFKYDIAGQSVSTVVTGSGGTQGEFLAPNGNLITADRDTRQISSRSMTDLSTVQSVLASTYNSSQFNGPNDVVVDSHGGIYFTDPNFVPVFDGPGTDAVYYISPLGVLSQFKSYVGAARPNGIILSTDEQSLYVGLYNSGVIRRYDVSTPGVFASETNFVGIGAPDGMTIDPWGNLIVGGIL